MADSGPPATAAAAAATAAEASPAQPNSPAGATGGVTATGILPASYWETVEHEIYDDDGDSAYSDLASSTDSITSSILEYRTLHGRTYHSDIGKAEFFEPNDERHLESMDLVHHLSTLLIDGKLFLAPIKDDVEKIVDIGTGTGVWAIDVGDAYPNADVVGTDVSAIQPSWVPANVKFEIDDANQNWTWRENSIDFIHVRMLVGAIADWPKFYREAFRCCKPGGWIEQHEASFLWRSQTGPIPEESALGQWNKVFNEGGAKFGRTFRLVDDDITKKCMEEAGFVDVVVKDLPCPYGLWPVDPKMRQLGTFAKLALETDIEGYILYMWNAIMGWSPVEVQVYIAHLRNQVNDHRRQLWFLRRVVYGRKPEAS